MTFLYQYGQSPCYQYSMGGGGGVGSTKQLRMQNKKKQNERTQQFPTIQNGNYNLDLSI